MSSENGNGFSCVLIGAESLLVQCAEILKEKGHDIRAIASRESTILDWARDRSLPLGVQHAAATRPRLH